jgi:uncharacterized protein (DUF1778 family)
MHLTRQDAMPDTTQISAQISTSVKTLLDEYSEATGVKKNRIIDDALWLYLRARVELPENVIVPPHLVLSNESADRVEAQLSSPVPPTPALVRVMRSLHPTDKG